MGNVHNTPFAGLGSALRAIRLRQKESLLEASGAIEVSGERLARFENGELRPSDDILELIISHYNMSEYEADKLWDLAGYKKQEDFQQPVNQVQTFMLGLVPQHIVFSDAVEVSFNDYGVTLNFMQQSFQQDQQVPVSRVGMSQQHAQKLLNILTQALQDSTLNSKNQKQLNPPKDQEN
ncbi:XRE family transcriptional regulator [bacterium]|nr:XRE family transcriptional regulator [bacterium]NBX97686.1 XRE family transcriptional regulator [bacterium]NDC94508.1 XRE family transcriptional regulator [bacterium]NDD83156.1 XRE family transcriptional regulator [bacterium]NDG29615.1 XRE family transcriptional regulator [bacterium]